MNDNDLVWLGTSEIAPDVSVTVIMSEVNNTDTYQIKIFWPKSNRDISTVKSLAREVIISP